MSTSTLYNSIVSQLEKAGRESAYAADANEPDPRYKGYGVRAAGKQRIYSAHRREIKKLDLHVKVELASRLISSRYGEQQSIALLILEQIPDYFTPDKFEILDQLIRSLHGWSKIDAYTGSLLKDVLFRYKEEFLELVKMWNNDSDLWLRRASVVLFTRKVAATGLYTDSALDNCENLKHDPEELVRKGVGWSLKDLMKNDKERILDYVLSLRAQGVSSVITLYALRDIKGKERAEIMGGG